MTIDNVLEVVQEFTKRLQLPESRYSFAINNSNEVVELIIFVDGYVKCTLSIGNGTLRVIYDDQYESDRYVSQKFLTPISLVYYLCVFFYNSVSDVSDMDFNDLLSVIFLTEVYDWKTLVEGIAENLGMDYTEDERSAFVNGIEIRYNGFLNKIVIDNTEIMLEESTYTAVVEAMFRCVEYVANVLDMADKLFADDNYSEEPEEEGAEEKESGSSGGSSEMDIDMDIDVGDETGGEPAEVAPVEPMENETFEEPQEPVVTVEDVV